MAKLVGAYFSEQPDPTVAAQRVAFGTSSVRAAVGKTVLST